MADLPLHSDVVIIGGGPAGLAAATQLRRMGVGSVVVLEREPAAGGIPRHCGHYPFGLREFRRLMKGPDYARRLVSEAVAAGVTICTGVTVTALLRGPRLQLATSRGQSGITASLVLLAIGARETSRTERLLGGTKPAGVMTTGTLQSMVYLEHLRPFKRPVILGTELVSFSAIMTCRHLGIKPVAMIEPKGRTTARWPTGVFPKLVGVPLHLNTECVSIHGRDVVTGVTIKDNNNTRNIGCDGVIVSGQFRPDAPLLHDSHLKCDPASGGPDVDQYGRCSDPHYFAAGNLLRAVGTAGWSWKEGHHMAQIMSAALNGALPDAAPIRLKTTGDALAYCVPQKLSPTCDIKPMPGLQLRVTRAVKGRLVLFIDGRQVATKTINALPERRIILPYPETPPGSEIELRLEEDAP